MTPFARVSAAGFAATAITFGPGRMGFGLFLSDFRSDFPMTSGTAGLVSGLGFFGFFLGLIAAYTMTARRGPRRPIALGLAAMGAGAALVAAAPGLTLLAAGTFLAMSSAGFSWAPFNNAVHRELPDEDRPLALSLVSTGTSLGVAAAGAIALAVATAGLSWRIAWVIFACSAFAAALLNLAALRDLAGHPGPTPGGPWSLLRQRTAAPLYALGLAFGVTTSIYISFAPDSIAQAGGLAGMGENGAASVLFMSYGAFGLAGLATGRLKRALGLPRLLTALLGISTLSHVLVALWPTSWPGVIASAGLQGIFVMMASATLSFWSERLFPTLPSLGFTVALVAVACGSVFGPVAAGFAADAFGFTAVFVSAAGLASATAAGLACARVSERAAEA